MTEIIEVELTEEQEADRAAQQEIFLSQQADIETREAAKVSAVVKLAKLGLTEDEAKAIVGI